MDEKLREKIFALSDRITEGVKHFNRGEFDQGRKILRAFLEEESDPRGYDIIALISIARSYEIEADIEKAEEEFLELIKKYPENFDINIAYSWFLMRNKRIKECLKYLLPFKQRESSSGKRQELYELLGLVSVYDEEYEEAEKYLKMVKEEFSNLKTFMPNLQLAEKLIDSNHFDYAVEYIRDVLPAIDSSVSRYLHAKRLLGTYYKKIGEIKNAIQEYRDGIKNQKFKETKVVRDMEEKITRLTLKQ